VRVLVAPDCFTGTLTAGEAAEAIATGWRRHAPADELVTVPLADGGPGFLDALHAALGGDLLPVTVPGPLGEPAPAAVLLVDGTAYLETAQVCGLHLVPADRRDPGVASTRGVGELLLAARRAGAGRVVVGLGGSATNDAGAGMIAALAAAAGAPDALVDRLAGGGAGLRGLARDDLAPDDLAPDDLAGLAEVVAGWSGTELVVASDVDVPLLGLQGASQVFGPQKGATAEQAAELDAALGDFALAAVQALDLPQKVVVQAGAGAAGGLGFGLFLLGAVRESGAQAVIDAVGLPERMADCDLAVTGEGCFDWQSLRGKVVTGVARTAQQAGRPVVVLAGQVQVGRREMLGIGVDAAYPVARTLDDVPAAMADPAGRLAALAERVARTWSR
jgi:glycerate kinase